MRSYLPYVGGKAKMAHRLTQLMPEHKVYAETHCGGAWVFFAKSPSKVEAINDADRNLITLHRVVEHHPEEFLRCLNKSLVTARQEYNRWRSLDVRYLTDIQRAVRFFVLMRLGWYGRPHGGHHICSGKTAPPLNRSTLAEVIQKASERLQNAWIECMDFEPFVERFDSGETLFFCDPPYEGSTAFYSTPWEPSDDERMQTMLNSVEGKVLITIKDSERVRTLYYGWNILPYTAIWSTRKRQPQNVNELIISNYDLSTGTLSI